MGWILLVALMSNSQGSMTTIEFSDYKSCMKAGEMIKTSINRQTPLFNSAIKYQCIKVGGLK